VALIVSSKVQQKLANKRPPVTISEIEECFATRSGTFLEDVREQHKSNPPTLWFISETYYGRQLKVVFIPKNGDIIIRSAYSPNKDELRIYRKFSQST